MGNASHKVQPMKNKAAAALGRKGGKARVKNQTPEQRSESSRHAAKVRWAKKVLDKQ